MNQAPYTVAHLSDIPTAAQEYGSYEWKPVRHHFGVRSFGVNANIGRAAGDWVIEEHTEVEDSGTRHEELYLVVSGHARFVVAGEEIDAPAGTFVHIPDPSTKRGARTVEPGTTVLAIGAEPGAAYRVSPWEEQHFA